MELSASPDQLLAQARQYGYTEGNQVWLRPVLDYPARPVGQVKESAEASLRYFAQRFARYQAKVEELLRDMEASDNKGSFLMKALHLKEQAGTYDALGDFAGLHQQLSAAEEAIQATVRHNRSKNLATKHSLIEQAEALHDTLDWQEGSSQLKELRQAWIKTGPVEKELTDKLEMRFQTAADAFYARKKEYLAVKKAMTNRTLDQYKDLIKRSEAIQNSTEFEETSRKLKALQQSWRDIGGNLPRKQATDLWASFRAAHNHFFERLKTHIETQRQQLAGGSTTGGNNGNGEENLRRKRALVAEAQALLERPMPEAVARAKELQAAWKQVGPVRGEESDQVWEQFIMACDRVFETSALDYYMRKRQAGAEPGAPATAPAEEAALRVQALREFIRLDQQERQVLADNLDKLSPTPANDTFRTLLQSKIRAFDRKIRTKKDLINMYLEGASHQSAPRSDR
ncbi:DUF349 domain-containing protein [Hymenobacter psychrophilus]|uniref:DUF349 domain-containing protein n=1 Tax=Hymenobacter psychrophilus TaxID=651662 RepID=A0A1H3HVM8_9BACT|nr:DUF349 domain-containing protein [Hymenobacter psychrophilus]SDY19490.1 protein of unknown function [Hymenobacter psychrophilus]